MKKIPAALIALFMLTFLVACGGDETPDNNVNTVRPVITTPDVTSSNPETQENTDDIQNNEPEPTWTGRVVNTDNGVNVRAEANTESEILTTADSGEEFIVVEQGDWYCVVLDNGTLGYINGDYMEIVEN